MRLDSRQDGRRGASVSSRRWLQASSVLLFLAGLSLINRHLAKSAERKHPPTGRFIDVGGVRLHYLDYGQGPPLVLLHGNGATTQDFAISGLLEMAAGRHRVIAFDRPGFGYSERPRGTAWTADAQARLLSQALVQLDVRNAIVLGHSWGASVALALGIAHPTEAAGLVLVSGYYYPTPRLDAVLLSVPAFPLVGDVLRNTIAPILGRMIWPFLMRKIFSPAPIPLKFRRFSKGMSLRPSQLRASAAESGLLIPDAIAASSKHGKVGIPVAIVAGLSDRVVDTRRQSVRLHHDIPGSRLHLVEGAGHMVHQTATHRVMAAIEEVTEEVQR
jgi:pimeloyl-ACP methyl ester carboxylesterase